ncbi:MAG: YciI family protein [Burkholderiales bacterium]
MSQFVLLYRSSNEAHREAMGSPEKAQASLTKWRAWIKEMTEEGQLKNVGEPLERTGKVVAGAKKMVTDGPFTESKDVIGGFSIVEARDMEQAAKIASGCPILEGGGSVEVRPVLKLDI